MKAPSDVVTHEYQAPHPVSGSEGRSAGWDLYSQMFESDDVVYLKLDGVQVDITMTGNLEHAPGTVLLRLLVATAKPLGRLPPAWERDDRWTKG